MSNEFIKNAKKYYNDKYDLKCFDENVLCGAWEFLCLYNPFGERLFNYNIIVLKTKYQGSAYYLDKIDKDVLINHMGRKINDLPYINDAFQLALIDSYVPQSISKKHYLLNGDSTKKSIERAKIVADYSVKLLNSGTFEKKEYDFLNIGVVKKIMMEITNRGYKIIGSDYEKFDSSFLIYDGSKTLELIKQVKVIIVTGMTMVNGTIVDIIKIAKQNNTKIIMFNESGARLSEYLLKLGVDIIISEEFPYYIFDGYSSINIYYNN